MKIRKAEWNRKWRQHFAEEHGYSTSANAHTGGLRAAVLARDGFACVQCGMTDTEHKARWARPITIDHLDRDKTNNTLDNLQTLCLRCHGRKDLLPHLRVEQVPEYKADILARRAAGQGYRTIATAIGFSEAAIWKWVKRWEEEDTP